ncbi:uncharacterized protein LOC119078893 [Bradysia coprophila]|uniref:uncharacterized protein LOC119078893 n=1 Tax=Bradysia coprophila TaxID=38358 RepID=UPI00187D7541|nr:uncharacterized protein LOC119078893 [Bradysia coprophila]
MNITDLGFDCLVQCFWHLSIEDLLNVFDAHWALKPAARHVFKRTHGHKMIRFDQIFKCDYLRYLRYLGLFRFSDKMVSIYQLKLCFQFLRCFGDLVHDIDFIFCYGKRHELIPRQWEHIFVHQLNKFCCGTLTQIRFDGSLVNYKNSDLNVLTKPFVRVERLKSQIFFPPQFKLNVLFPKLRELELLNIKYDPATYDGDVFLNNDFMANRFPYLEHLTINLEPRYRYEKENFAIAVRLSPNIKALKGNIWFEVLFKPNLFVPLWNADRHFQILENLDLVVNLHFKPRLTEILTTTASQYLHFKNLKELRILFCDQSIDDTVTEWKFPFICEKLESLTLLSSHGRLKQFSNILNKHPTVKKLEIKYYGMAMTADECSTISKAFPLLEEIIFKTLPEDIGGAINMFGSLKCFKYYTTPTDSYFVAGHILRTLTGWSVSNIILDPRTDTHRLIQGQRNN